MKRVIVIGSPGAGKSTFAKKLAALTGIPLHHLDMVYHRPDKTHISREEFDMKLAGIMAEEAWIIDGNYSRTIEARLKECDTVFLLDYPLEVCLSGALERVGTQRDDMPWAEKELDSEFRRFIEEFPEKEMPKIYRLIEKYKDKRDVIILRSREEAGKWLAEYPR